MQDCPPSKLETSSQGITENSRKSLNEFVIMVKSF